jgi:hypothetical protein
MVADAGEVDELGPMFGQLALLPVAPEWFAACMNITRE